MELAELEPATSWVRSPRSPAQIRLDQRLPEPAVGSPNIFPNILPLVPQSDNTNR